MITWNSLPISRVVLASSFSSHSKQNSLTLTSSIIRLIFGFHLPISYHIKQLLLIWKPLWDSNRREFQAEMFSWKEEGANQFWSCKSSLTGMFGVSWDCPEVGLDSPAKPTTWKASWVCGGVCWRVFLEEHISRCALWEGPRELDPGEPVRKQLQCKMTMD